MELVPIINVILLVVVCTLVLVVLLSFILSKTQNKKSNRNNIVSTNHIPNFQPITIPTSIKVIHSTRPKKLRSDTTQIFYSKKLRNTAQNERTPEPNSDYQTNFFSHLDKYKIQQYTHDDSKPRFTILNNKLKISQSKNRNHVEDKRYNKVSFHGR